MKILTKYSIHLKAFKRMENKSIEGHNFKKQLSEIGKLAQTTPRAITLPTFETKGNLIGWNAHNVTGKEANELVSNIQSAFIEANERFRTLYREFHKVYNAFNQLDKEYIRGILGAIESANKASEQAMLAQKDINKTIEGLKATVQVLKNFKESTTSQLDIIGRTIHSLVDVGTLESLKSSLSELQNQLNEIGKQLDKTKDQTQKDLLILQNYHSELQSYKHLADIDSLWEDVERQKASILANKQEQITLTKEFYRNREEQQSSFNDINKRIEQDERIVSSKIKTAYAIAAGAASLSIIQLVLRLVGLL